MLYLVHSWKFILVLENGDHFKYSPKVLTKFILIHNITWVNISLLENEKLIFKEREKSMYLLEFKKTMFLPNILKVYDFLYI